jgi:hypothetical protein
MQMKKRASLLPSRMLGYAGTIRGCDTSEKHSQYKAFYGACWKCRNITYKPFISNTYLYITI